MLYEVITKHRIIVVEDEDPIREMLTIYLNDAGYETKGYSNGIDALSDFDRNNFV